MNYRFHRAALAEHLGEVAFYESRLPGLGADYLALAQQHGISPDLLHRVAVMASGCLDSLPHCGAIVTLLAICKLTHRQSYGHIAVITMAVPMVALTVVIALGTLFGGF